MIPVSILIDTEILTTGKVFMTQRKTIQCVHEPFGDAFYYGPERLSERFENDEQARIDSGFSQSTFKTILDRLDREASHVWLLLFPSLFPASPPHSLLFRGSAMPRIPASERWR